MTSFTHDTAPTQYAEGGGIRFAYRRFGGPGRPPLVFYQHFMGTMDDHDPALSDAFAGDREVILFNNTGVASSSGIVPDTIEAMARDAITFTDALGLTTIDVVGHSMGGLVAQEVALARPDLVRRLVLVGTGPRGGEGIGARPDWVGKLFARKYQRQEDMWLPILFAPTRTSQAAGRAYIERIVARADRDTPVSDQSIAAQRAAIAAYGAAKDPSYANLKGLELPVLVVNGTDDIIIPTINSYILQQFLPDAELILYPDAGHGSHFQYPRLFVRHARIFLDD
ncbi:MAG: alpha/beta hydrolase [Trebonia sp.]|uniref:alpha/beta fold hydrolase n=1 Tax=Trebonia sp. TaxID=2767075 RepID=UPI003BB07B20